MAKKLTTKDFIEKSMKIHGYKYDYSKSVYIGTFDDITIICKIHGEFKQRPNNHLNGLGCQKCGYVDMKNKQKDNSFIERSKLVHGSKYNYELVEYVNNRTNVKMLCNDCGNIIEQSPSNNIKYDCPYCSGRLFDEKVFIKNANKIHNNKYDYSKMEYKSAKEKITIICSIHGDFKQRTGHHLTCGCQKCSKKHKHSTREYIDICNEIHDYKYDYTITEYINAKTKVKIICPEHGKFNQQASSHISGKGCPSCCESKGEKQIVRILNKKNIKYIRQKYFDGCNNIRKLYFDFYLPESNTCIEYDGKQHFEAIEYWGGQNNFEKIIKRDEIKNGYCKENNIRLIRIKYNEKVNEKLLECGILTPKFY